MKKRFTVGLDPELRQPLMRKVASINLKLSEDSEEFISLHRYVSDLLARDLGVTYEFGGQRVGSHKADGPPLDACRSETAKAAIRSPKGRREIPIVMHVKELVSIAKEQHMRLTYDDINNALPEDVTPEEMEEMKARLDSFEVEIVEQAEIDRLKKNDQEDDK